MNVIETILMGRTAMEISIYNVLKNMVSEHSRQNVFLRYFEEIRITKDMLHLLVEDESKFVIWEHTFSKHTVQGPFEPFFTWIRKWYEENWTTDVDSFLQQCNIYPKQRDLFISYLATGHFYSDDIVLLVEKEYEMERFFESLIHILQFITSKGKYLFVFSHLHLAQKSTLVFLEQLISLKCPNIYILGSYNIIHTVPSYNIDVWREFTEYIEQEQMDVDMGVLKLGEEIGNKEQETTSINCFSVSEFSQCMEQISNLMYGLCYTQALYYLEQIEPALKENKETLEYELVAKYHLFYVHALLYTNRPEEALVYAQTFYQELEEKQDKKLMAYTKFYISLCFVEIKQDKSYEIAKEGIALAEETEDSLLVIKMKVLLKIVKYSGFKRDFQIKWVDCEEHEESIQLLEELKERGLYNLVAYISLFDLENSKEELIEFATEKGTLSYFEHAIRYGHELDNQVFLLAAYGEKIKLLIETECYEEALEFHLKKLELYDKHPNKRREANSYNGIGYLSILSEKPSRADMYFKKALDIMIEKNRPESAAECLYNFAMNHLAIGDYQYASYLFELILEVLKLQNIQNLPMANNAKLHIFLAASCYYNQDFYHCYMNLNLVEIALDPILGCEDDHIIRPWSEELFLYCLVKGGVYRVQNAYEEALLMYEKAEHYYQYVVNNKFFYLPLFCKDKFELLLLMGDKNGANKEIDKAIDYCMEHKHYKKAGELEAIRDGKIFKREEYSFAIPLETIEKIKEIARVKGLERCALDRQKDIEFLYNLQIRFTQTEENKEEIVRNSMIHIQSIVKFDEMLVLSQEQGRDFDILYNDLGELNQSEQEGIVQYFTEHSYPFVVSRMDGKFKDYQGILQYFNPATIISLMGIPVHSNGKLQAIFVGIIRTTQYFVSAENTVGEEKLIIAQSAFMQFLAAYERVKSLIQLQGMNQRLKDTAQRDFLTGLYNRQGLTDLLRQSMKKKEENHYFIFYLDLDHFKYYNDTFGHKFGDYILVHMAKLLNKYAKDKGDVIRYGGDEFLILFMDMSKDEAKELAASLLKEMLNDFKEEIQSEVMKQVGHEVIIPREKQISSSIGIASFEVWDEVHFNRAVNQADAALYRIKKTTKSDYCFYNEKDF